MQKILPVLLLFLMHTSDCFAQDSHTFSTQEIIYGRKDGMALTMVKLSPAKKANAKAIINVVSGNFFSSFDWVPRYIERSKIYVDNGYTVFIVVHGSQPRYAIPDEISDVKRAIRFIRFHAADYGIDPAHIGITGSSAGGHLSLLAALSDDDANKAAKDPVDTTSAAIQAVAVFYPPTDFLNYGAPGNQPGNNPEFLRQAGVYAAFDFREWNDSVKTIVSITDTLRRTRIAKALSPVSHVSPNDPPVYIVHGDADVVVPIQQSFLLMEKLEKAKVPHQLKVMQGKGHGWPGQQQEDVHLLKWFQKWL